MKFRYDINGLRAIAVISVVLFHFKPSALPGGFAGVDVFFVISGFLMTGIIFSGIENNTFKLFKFYVARANRIVPALSIVCISLLVLGWFYFTPIDYQTLGKHVAGSISFLSNIVYLTESGYFDSSSHEKWLLHTWSLSVEWQFYIFYPLIILILKRFFSIESLKIIVIVLTAFSFITSIYVTAYFPELAYYLFPTRAWEMMIGGIAFLYPFREALNKKNKHLEIVGLILIVGSCFFVSSGTPWPGYMAFIPVFGAFLVLVSNQQNSKLTNNVVFQSLGRWSYSIYLWHWPVLVFMYYFECRSTGLGVLISVLLGWLSYRFIENKKLKSRDNWLDFYKVSCLWTIFFIGALSSATYVSHGFSSRYPELNELSKDIKMPHRGNGYCFYSFKNDNKLEVDARLATNCYLGDKNGSDSNILLFGDSFAGHYDPMLDRVFKDKHEFYQSVTTNWCYPSFSGGFVGPKTHPSFKQCLLNRKFLEESINQRRYKMIIFSASWDVLYEDNKDHYKDFTKVLERASEKGIKVIVLPSPHRYKKNPISNWERLVMENEDKISIEKFLVPNEGNMYLEKLASEFGNVSFIKQEEIFNKDGMFIYQGVKMPYTLDGLHISVIGSLAAYENIKTQEGLFE